MIFGRVYCVTNLVNGKRYVGKTKLTTDERWRQHCRSRRFSLLIKAIKKYGIDAFRIEELETASSLRELNELERKWITAYGSKAPNGYNLQDGGDGGNAHPDTRKRIAESMARPEVKAKQREGLRRFWDDEENKKRTIERLVEIRRENYRNGRRHKKHRTWSAEDKRRHSEQRKEIWKRPEYRAKLAEARKIWFTPEVREKMGRRRWKGGKE